MNPHALAIHSTRVMLRQRLNVRWLLLFATAVAVVLALVAVVAYAFAGGFDKLTTEHAGGGGTQIVRVELVDVSLGFDITPDVVTVEPGTHLILEVVNEGKEVHVLALDGGVKRTRRLNPGESQRLDIGTITHDVGSWCTPPGHKFFGMALEIRVDQSP